MRMTCPHCLHSAACYKSDPMSAITRENAYRCKNPECGHTFVASVLITHTIIPSRIPREGINLRISDDPKIKHPNDEDKTVMTLNTRAEELLLKSQATHLFDEQLIDHVTATLVDEFSVSTDTAENATRQQWAFMNNKTGSYIDLASTTSDCIRLITKDGCKYVTVHELTEMLQTGE